MKSLFYLLTIIGLVCLKSYSLQAAHIIGGEITYECLGWTGGDPNSGSRSYQFVMKIYRDCQGGGAGFDSAPNGSFLATVSIYRADSSLAIMNITLGPPSISFVDPDPGNPCLIIPSNVCVQEAVYVFPVVDLPVIEHSYFIAYQRCCRNNTITNIIDPGGSGATYSIELTAAAQAYCNNSPTFDYFPPAVICGGEPFSFDHSATDVDGDQLIYSFCTPFLGGGLNFDDPDSMDGLAPNPESPPPYTPVTFIPPNYSALDPLGVSSNVNISNSTGLITGMPQIQGQFVVGVCVSEYRNGEYLGTVSRDFQFNVSSCDPVVAAEIPGQAVINGSDYLFAVCGEKQILFENESYPVASIDEVAWQFYLGDRDTIAYSWDATIVFPDYGEYRGRLIVNPNTLCSDTAFIVARLFPPVEADFSFQYDSCVASPVHFTDLSVAEGSEILFWNWTFESGRGSSEINPVYQYDDPGIKVTKLKITDDNGCQDSTLRQIQYFPAPEVLLVSPSRFVGCAPGSITFSNLSEPVDETYQVFWDFGDGGTSEAFNPTYIFEQPGLWSVYLDVVSPNGCHVDTLFRDLIRIDAPPEARFNYTPQALDVFNKTVQFEDQSERAEHWYWDFEGVAYSTLQEPVYTLPDTGLQQVALIVTDQHGCKDTLVQVLDVVPLVTYFLPNAFSPNDDSVNDVFKGKGYLRGLKAFDLSIWSRWGELIFQTNDPETGWNGQKNNEGQPLPAGIYPCVVKYTDPRGTQVEVSGWATLVR
ncbi:MAG TPA: PKD domain-containing protein [Saprospiraceae bacterium]|nr:PKD domain-containing protein [Saprospiraceae bacterium]HMQ85201.1 PKD domain-containing protein [Saprospiraceae bacterium]